MSTPESVFRVLVPCLLLTIGACADAPRTDTAGSQGTTPGGPSSPTPTLDGVRRKGFVQCGVSTGVAGFSAPDAQGQWRGLDVDVCRAIAAAVLGDATKVRFTPLTAAQRFTALQTGEIDVLSRVTTITFQRDVQLGHRVSRHQLVRRHRLPRAQVARRDVGQAISTARPSACSPAPPTRSTLPTTSASNHLRSRRS